MNAILVRREESPTPSLFGPVRWWGVWLTPFEKVATFAYWPDAMYFANLVARVPASTGPVAGVNRA